MLGFTVGMALQALLISSTAAYTPLSSDQYWKVQTPLNYSDVLYAGWPQIPVASEVEVYNGVSFNRTVVSPSACTRCSRYLLHILKFELGIEHCLLSILLGPPIPVFQAVGNIEIRGRRGMGRTWWVTGFQINSEL